MPSCVLELALSEAILIEIRRRLVLAIRQLAKIDAIRQVIQTVDCIIWYQRRADE